jgi:hypothetical protein
LLLVEDCRTQAQAVAVVDFKTYFSGLAMVVMVVQGLLLLDTQYKEKANGKR